jgi:glycosyltransferase involved in cell wall biosynthesis
MDMEGDAFGRSNARESARGAHSAVPRILVLTIVNPEIERNGAASVTRGLLQCLTRPPLRASLVCIPARQRPRKWHRVSQFVSLLRAAYSGLPSKAVFLQSRKFDEQVRVQTQAEHFDLVVLNGADLLSIQPHLRGSAPRLLVAHNIEHLLFDSQIATLNGVFRVLGGWLQRDARRLRRFELDGMCSVGNVIFLSHADADLCRADCPDARFTTIPPLFDYRPNFIRRRGTGSELRIGYVGNFNWWPNRQGLEWFASQVLPQVTTPVRLHLFGAGSDHAWPGDIRVSGHGVVEDLNRMWEQCDFMICPAFAESGVCVKLAEAIYNRVPVLANRHAARGLPLENDPAIVFAEQAAEWVGFLNSPAARELAECTVSEANASKFAVDSYVSVVQNLVRTSIQAGRPQ